MKCVLVKAGGKGEGKEGKEEEEEEEGGRRRFKGNSWTVREKRALNTAPKMGKVPLYWSKIAREAEKQIWRKSYSNLLQRDALGKCRPALPSSSGEAVCLRRPHAPPFILCLRPLSQQAHLFRP